PSLWDTSQSDTSVFPFYLTLVSIKSILPHSVVRQPIRVKKVEIRLHCYLLEYTGQCQYDEANAIQDSRSPT
ncbi:MAG: hypothetical protein JW732_00645, partial [Dehalococcoidia bacterium]|nr:hypothetical protein [Dehalococcoidia bacterium]